MGPFIRPGLAQPANLIGPAGPVPYRVDPSLSGKVGLLGNLYLAWLSGKFLTGPTLTRFADWFLNPLAGWPLTDQAGRLASDRTWPANTLAGTVRLAVGRAWLTSGWAVRLAAGRAWLTPGWAARLAAGMAWLTPGWAVRLAAGRAWLTPGWAARLAAGMAWLTSGWAVRLAAGRAWLTPGWAARLAAGRAWLTPGWAVRLAAGRAWLTPGWAVRLAAGRAWLTPGWAFRLAAAKGLAARLVSDGAASVYADRVGAGLRAAALLAGLPGARRAAGPVEVGLLLDHLKQRHLQYSLI